jgi:hypothetical protein
MNFQQNRSICKEISRKYHSQCLTFASKQKRKKIWNEK